MTTKITKLVQGSETFVVEVSTPIGCYDVNFTNEEDVVKFIDGEWVKNTAGMSRHLDYEEYVSNVYKETNYDIEYK